MCSKDVVLQQRDGLPTPTGLLKTIFVLYRRHLAARTESLAAKTFHRELLTTVRRELVALDAVVNSSWFQCLISWPLPRLKDFLSIQRIEEHFSHDKLPAREYDEKFHTLLAPTLFFPDLAYLRARCARRGRPLAVAFVDIDKFKEFNTKHLEAKVDTNLLPIFMHTLEAHVYHHGYAYRQGGDEYLLIVPSMSRKMAISFIDDIRLEVAALEYPEIPERTTVSIGLCVVGADSPFTDLELLGKANNAKKFAKDSGRNRIATYADDRLRDEEMLVVSG
jgi:diguanylate cyclase (GGDEF)-like protein